ncbi:MAG: DUF3109 family protein [Bacteroidales bacterium]
MLQIGDKIISLDILQESFCCNLEKCKGNCCVYGDSGAPLEKSEAKILEKNYKVIKPFMRKEGIQTVNKKGSSVIDKDGDLVTPLVNNGECAYVFFENGIAFCAIEKAFNEGEINFRKPVSCHLYPVRVKKYSNFTGLNYDRWDICNPAIEKGEKLNLPLFVFVKDALERMFDSKFTEELKIAIDEIEKSEKNKILPNKSGK